MKNYKDPTVKVIVFSAQDVIATSGGSDTTTPEGGNILPPTNPGTVEDQ